MADSAPKIPAQAHRLKAGMWDSYVTGAAAAAAGTVATFGILRMSPLIRLAVGTTSRPQQVAASCLAGGLIGSLGSLVSMQLVMSEVRRMPRPGRQQLTTAGD